MRRFSNIEFLKKAMSVHGATYDYSKVNYLGERVKIKITCPIHGEFKQLPSNHINLKQGCPACYGNKKLTTLEFISKAKLIHGNLYEYNDTVYSGNKGKVKVICKKHGLFLQTATRHLCGDGCPKCGGSMKLDENDFIIRAKKIHGNKYDYSMVNYKNSKNKVKIICLKHGVFEQKPSNHIGKQSQGCRLCAITKQTLTTEKFIEKAKKIHDELYDYSKTNYIKNNQPITIICKKHGEFQQNSNSHLSGRGCKICKNSKGELKILNWLKLNNIRFEYQKEFEGCFNVRPLKFDFYLPDFNIVIEFDGDQHKIKNDFFGGIDGFKYRKINDEIKNQYVKIKGIGLLRIPYNDLRNNKIELVLENNLN